MAPNHIWKPKMGRKFYLLSADYGCFPLWQRAGDGYINLNPMTLALSAPLRSRLRRWRARFEATYDPRRPAASGFKTSRGAAAFDEEGGRIAEALRVELAPASVRYLLSARVRPARL